MIRDKTLFIAAAGLVQSLTLADAHMLASTLLTLASVGYVVTKWILLVRGKKPPAD